MEFIDAIKNWFELKIKLWTKKDRIDSVSGADFKRVKKRFLDFYGS